MREDIQTHARCFASYRLRIIGVRTEEEPKRSSITPTPGAAIGQRSAGIRGHVQSEWAVTIGRNTQKVGTARRDSPARSPWGRLSGPRRRRPARKIARDTWLFADLEPALDRRQDSRGRTRSNLAPKG